MSDCTTPEPLEPIYQWKHSNRSVIGKTWWQDCTKADFDARDNKPQFDVRIVFETTATIESLRSTVALKEKSSSPQEMIAALKKLIRLYQKMIYILQNRDKP